MKAITTLILCAFALEYLNAQIVYTEVKPDLVINGAYNLDLNNDGTTDFVINDSTWTAILTNCGEVTEYTISVTPLSGNAVLCDSNHNPFPFQANEVIEAAGPFSLSWSAIFGQLLQGKGFVCRPYTDRTCSCTRYGLVSSYNGAWPNGLEAYLGLKLIKNGNTYFGWVRLLFFNNHAKIRDYAYNSMPGQSILARQGGNTLPEVIPVIQWQKSLAGPDGLDNSQNGRSLIQSVQQTADGGYILSGATELSFADGSATGWHQGVDNGGYLTRDYWIVRLDNTGNVVWGKALGGTGDDYAMSIQQTTDGGYIVAGYTTSNNGDVTGLHQGVDENGNPTGDYWIVKLNTTGDIVWEKCLGGTGGDGAASIQQTADGGYIVAGVSGSDDGDVTGAHHGAAFHNAPPNADYWVVKLDNNGNITWQKCLGGSNGDEASSIQQTADGGYIVAGSSGSYDGDVLMDADAPSKRTECWVVKLNNAGNISWEKNFGGSFSDGAQSIRQTSDGGYIMAGSSLSNDGDVTVNFGSADYWVVKLDDSGNISWQKSLGSTDHDLAQFIQQTADGGYIVTGEAGANNVEVAGNHGDYDYWVVKLDNGGNISWRKSLGGTGDDEAKSIQQTADGGYILAGFSNSNDGDVTGNHGGFDIWIVKLGTDNVLPLRLLSFTGVLQNNAVKLNWQTTNEINTKDFIVERSADAINFSVIGRVAAQTSSATTHSYHYTDNAPLPGINFYRLKMEDNDSRFTYSNIIRVKFNKGYSLNVSPVPAHNAVTIAGAENFTAVQFIDAGGRIVKQFGKMPDNLFPVADLNKGIYFIRLVSGSENRIFKIIKE